MPAAVAVLWIITLVVAYLAVPLLVFMLWRIVRASQKIERYTRETRIASRGISTTLEALPALNKTEELLQGAHSLGGDLAIGAEAMAAVLAKKGEPMTTLIALSLVWVAAVVLVLVITLGATAWNLRRARVNLRGIADDLERIGAQAEPLEGKLTSVGTEVEAIVGALGRVDGALGAILDVVAGLLAPSRS